MRTEKHCFTKKALATVSVEAYKQTHSPSQMAWSGLAATWHSQITYENNQVKLLNKFPLQLFSFMTYRNILKT